MVDVTNQTVPAKRAVPAPDAPSTAAKKTPVKRTPTKRTSSTKAVAKKSVATKATVKKSAPTAAVAKKAPAKKAAPKKAAPARRPTTSQPPERMSMVSRHHPYRTLADRVARGEQWRTTAPLSTMDDLHVASDRPRAIDLLRAQDDYRIPELVPIRYGRMSASAFAFYRGSAAVMAYDLAQQPRTPGGTQICGDAHISNFGFFASPERDLVFDVNDFDETLPGPFEWDVKRMAASVTLAARDAGFKNKDSRRCVVQAVEGYRNTLRALAGMDNMSVWYFKLDADQIRDAILLIARDDFGKKTLRQAEQKVDAIFAKARGKTSLRAAEKLTEVVDGHRRFRNDPPLLVRAELIGVGESAVAGVFQEYLDTLNNDRRRLLERFHFIDLALKVVGVGSVGTRAFAILLEGRDSKDLLMMQAKQAQASVLEAYLRPSVYENHGQRVVEGQRYMQAASDIFLGWSRGPNADFYIRQLHDMKGSVDLARLKPLGLQAYARLCGVTLARAHARGGDVVAIASYMGEDDTFASAIARFAESYADLAEKDFSDLQNAIKNKEVVATTGI